MSRIASRLKAQHPRKGMIPFITAGDPDLEGSLRLAAALGNSCADVLELGVPFSDPVADGPVIQRASQRALARGTRLSGVLDLVRQLRMESDVPVVLFSYFNPILRYGIDRFSREAADSGVDGVLLTDLPPEESGPYLASLRGAGLDTIFLASPTTTEQRLGRIAQATSGFLYLVSRTGVTGERDSLPAEIEKKVRQARAATPLPIAVGFGISRPEHVQEIWRVADAAVVGSALVRKVEELSGQAGWVDKVTRFACSLKKVG